MFSAITGVAYPLRCSKGECGKRGREIKMLVAGRRAIILSALTLIFFQQ